MTERAEQQPIRALLVEDDPGDARLPRAGLADLPKMAFDVAHIARLADALNWLDGGLFRKRSAEGDIETAGSGALCSATARSFRGGAFRALRL